MGWVGGGGYPAHLQYKKFFKFLDMKTLFFYLHKKNKVFISSSCFKKNITLSLYIALQYDSVIFFLSLPFSLGGTMKEKGRE